MQKAKVAMGHSLPIPMKKVCEKKVILNEMLVFDKCIFMSSISTKII